MFISNKKTKTHSYKTFETKYPYFYIIKFKEFRKLKKFYNWINLDNKYFLSEIDKIKLPNNIEKLESYLKNKNKLKELTGKKITLLKKYKQSLMQKMFI